jgi:serine/threonine-protein kinase
MPSVESAAPLTVRSASRAKEEEKRRKKKRAVIIAIVAAVLSIALIGVAIYVITSGGGKVEVPNVVGQTEEKAREELEAAGLKVGIAKPEASEDVPKGEVISTDPSARTKVDKGSVVDLVVSLGPETPKDVEVPNLSNETPENAKTLLAALNLEYDRGDDQFSADIAVGKICAQEPAAGTKLKEGQTVTIHVSKGKETGGVPSVIDMTEADAISTIEGAGFKVDYTDSEYSDKAAGTVIRQSPTSGGQADKGSTITITLSLGPEPVTLPDLTGLDLAEATDKLRGLGLYITSLDTPVDQVSQLNKVVSQEPAAGTSVDKGSTITVYIGKAATP